MVPGLSYDIPLKQNCYPSAYFAEEEKGWHGYVEWEKYPEKKKEAADVLAKYSFAQVTATASLKAEVRSLNALQF